MTPPRLLFAHGWALNRSLWDQVLPLLGPLAEDAVVLDAGYYGAPAPPPAFEPGRPVLGVGQSLGALELLAEPATPLVGLVALDGFARFSAAPDFPEGSAGRILGLMARRMRVSAGAVVADFLQRALSGVGRPPPPYLDIDALARGLERLAHLDGRAAAQTLPIWRLHAAHDPVAPLALADASFAGADVRGRRVREAADHLSPMTAPQACADLVRSAVLSLTR